MKRVIGKLVRTDFTVQETIEDTTSNEKFYLHDHDSYEILLFLEGDAKFVIEGNDYFLETGDVIIVRKHEMHRVYHNSNATYHRVVLMVEPNFFSNHNCMNYETQFANAQMGIANIIKAKNVRSCGLYDAFMRLKKVSVDYSLTNEPVVDAIVIEILYYINRSGIFSTPDVHDSQVEKVISYINTHYTEDISLDTLENIFFLSKHHLCRIFRKATGLTIHEYISRKRINKVKELRKIGKSISDAAMLSGFCDYSCFYRTYKKLMGCSPKEDVDRFYSNM